LRRGLALVCVVTVAVGCTGSARHPTATSSPSPSVGSSPRTTAPASRALPALVLRADLDDVPGKWERVAFIPFGAGHEQLGFKAFHEGPSSLPSALAVGADGSFWIDDRWKRRVVHYSPSGQFLGSAGPLSGPGWDLAVLDGVVFVLVEQMTGTIGRVARDDVVHVDVVYQDQPLFVFQLVRTGQGLVAEAAEVPGVRAGEVGSFVALDLPNREAVEVLPGLPLGSGAMYFDASLAAEPVHRHGDQDFDLLFASKETSQVQPLQVELIVSHGGKERSVPAEVGLTEPLPVADDVLLLVKVAPTRPTDAETFGGGRWLLRLGRSALLWERLPYPGIPDELQHRHLAVGPDGSIYLMVVQKGGEVILRRPASAA